MKNRLGMFCAMMGGLLVVSGLAIGMDDDGEEAPKKRPERKPPAPLEDLTLTGTLTKTEREGKDGKTRVTYTLTDAQGAKIRVPPPRAPRVKKGEEAPPPAIDLEDFVDQEVVVEGKGRVTERGGKKSVRLQSVTSVKAQDGDGPADGDADGDEDMGGDMDGDDMW